MLTLVKLFMEMIWIITNPIPKADRLRDQKKGPFLKLPKGELILMALALAWLLE
ncbi:MAG TPA: hypothetical protein VLB04_00600 [Methanotrichaceae archaeon]|nr:hypothetical protein [Methanotrichaceae archaeon]